MYGNGPLFLFENISLRSMSYYWYWISQKSKLTRCSAKHNLHQTHHTDKETELIRTVIIISTSSVFLFVQNYVDGKATCYMYSIVLRLCFLLSIYRLENVYLARFLQSSIRESKVCQRNRAARGVQSVQSAHCIPRRSNRRRTSKPGPKYNIVPLTSLSGTHWVKIKQCVVFWTVQHSFWRFWRRIESR